MPVPVPWAGVKVSLYRISPRHLKLRGPRKKNKPFVVPKAMSIPSETKYSLQARIALAEAAISARGKTFEEVVATVIDRCAGQTYKPESVKKAEKETQYKRAEANLERMRRKLAQLEAPGMGMTTEEYLATRGLAGL